MSDVSNPVQNVTFASNGDEAFGYLALPASGSGPGLIVIQEWWGLTTHMAHMADRFADEGYVALAPIFTAEPPRTTKVKRYSCCWGYPSTGQPKIFEAQSTI